MSTINRTKINKLLSSQPQGAVMLSSWLTEQGYNPDLQKRYRKSGWLESIGTGAMIRMGDNVGYEGAVHALQKQLGSTIHIGGKTALSLLGKAHYLEFATAKVTLFGGAEEKLPSWFKQYNWNIKVDYYGSSFLPSDIGMTELEFKSFTVKISGAARAMMECLYLAPEKQQLLECYEMMEGLNNLRPNLVQQLLEACQSVKVKRLFLYMAEKSGHDWFKYLNLEKINMGSGKRSIVKNGVYVSKYQIIISKELESHGKASV
ncbi:MAG: type IV toxin-antitoxin system AbiEi family antitoxin [Alphaproteobacteria bacterium]|nr:type IV toxin-antitoxin system AbiEi family antitoxin [Alphaproteobacteria bacterium]